MSSNFYKEGEGDQEEARRQEFLKKGALLVWRSRLDEDGRHFVGQPLGRCRKFST